MVDRTGQKRREEERRKEQDSLFFYLVLIIFVSRAFSQKTDCGIANVANVLAQSQQN